MTDKRIEEAIAQLIEEEITNKISEIDRIVETQDLLIKDSLNKKLEKTMGIKLMKRMYFNPKNVVIVSLIIFSIICITRPKTVTAILNLGIQLYTFCTGQSIDISTKEVDKDNFWNNIQITIPNEFILDESKSKQIRNLNRVSYLDANNKDTYITLTSYDKNYWLSLDNENADHFSNNDKVNNHKVMAVTKNGISTVVILYNDLFIVEIESNLPLEDVLAIANSIK